MAKTCPSLGGATSLREVIYGPPDGPPDESKYMTGGCCNSESDPMTTYINCGWEGDFTNHLQTLGLTVLSI